MWVSKFKKKSYFLLDFNFNQNLKNIDIAITSIPLSVEIEKVIDFTHSFKNEKISMLLRKRQILTEKISSIFEPFTLGLWSICFSMCICDHLYLGRFEIIILFLLFLII